MKETLQEKLSLDGRKTLAGSYGCLCCWVRVSLRGFLCACRSRAWPFVTCEFLSHFISRDDHQATNKSWREQRPNTTCYLHKEAMFAAHPFKFVLPITTQITSPLVTVTSRRHNSQPRGKDLRPTVLSSMLRRDSLA